MGCFSGSKSKEQSSSYLPAQATWLTKALELYGKELGQNDTVYQGDRLAGFTDLQNTAINNAGNFANIFSQPNQVGTPLSGETGSAIKGLLSGDTGASKITDEQSNQYFSQKIQDPTMRMLKNDLLPTVDEGYAGGDFFGSARGKARDAVTTDVANNLTEQKASLDWNVLQNNQAIDEAKAGRTLGTLGSAMQYGQQPAQETMNNLKIAASQVQGLQELLGIGSAEQTQQQREIETAIAKFAEENQITDADNMGILLNLLGMNMKSSSGSESGPGLGYSAVDSFMGGFSGGLGGAAGAALIASDIRVKENLEPITITDKLKTLKPYKYNYIGQTQKRIGLIAQDVEKVFPEAVIEVDGIKHVDLYALMAIVVGILSESAGE